MLDGGYLNVFNAVTWVLKSTALLDLIHRKILLLLLANSTDKLATSIMLSFGLGNG